MFTVPEEIEVTERMLNAGHDALSGHVHDLYKSWIGYDEVLSEVYRAMEQARREGMVKVSWSEPGDASKW